MAQWKSTRYIVHFSAPSLSLSLSLLFSHSLTLTLFLFLTLRQAEFCGTKHLSMLENCKNVHVAMWVSKFYPILWENFEIQHVALRNIDEL